MESRLRQFLIIMVTTPEDIVPLHKAEQDPEKYGIEDLTVSQNLSRIRIVDGKIVSENSVKKYSVIFEYFIIGCILLSCIILCINTPIEDPDDPLTTSLNVVDYILTFVFAIEAILKILAFGFVWNHFDSIKPYVWNSWNMLDFTVVILSLVDFSMSVNSSSSQNLSSFKALRAIRALRPLRVISRSESLKILIQALFSSIPAMGNVLLVCVLFLLIFAILAVEFFKGAYYR